MSREKPDFNFYSLMRSESSRLGTYHDFPQSAAVRPGPLASSGFFYSGRNDRVTCAFCRQVLEDWEHGDEPVCEHKKHSPYCLFIKGEDVGNVPASGGTMNTNVSDSVSRPTRLSTSNAPRSLPPVATPNRVINANNKVLPNLQTQGVQLRPAAFTSIAHTNTSVTTQSPRTLQARDLKARLDRPMAKMMIEKMGFDAQLVKQAIYERLLTAGEDFDCAEHLAQAVMELQDKQEAESAQRAAQQNEVSQRLHNTNPPSSTGQGHSTTDSQTGVNTVCKSCKIKVANTAFIPCHHVLFCQQCAQEPSFCQECGIRIKGTRER